MLADKASRAIHIAQGVLNRRRAHDIAVFVLTALSIAVIVTMIMWRFLVEAVDDSGVLVFMAATVLAVFGSTGWWTAREYRALSTHKPSRKISDSETAGEDPQ